MWKTNSLLTEICNEGATRNHRLKEIGIDESIIIDVAKNAITFKTDANEFDTIPGPGVAQWNAIVKGLRVKTNNKGWEKYNYNGVEGIKATDRSIIVLPIAGNAATGNPQQPAGFKKNRGTAGIKLMEKSIKSKDKNTQGALFEGFVDKTVDEIQDIYILLYYNNNKELRLELSQPSQIIAGAVKAWKERIIFPPIEIDNLKLSVDNINDDEEFDITIIPKTECN